jgi:A/G-specific adenine glycosylase
MINLEPLRHWFSNQKRDLPWRDTPTPYAVFISEIMLQQTQVAVVIPYFLRWMERFPNFQTLADSKEEEVLKLWEGLGYYSRARNLHKGAKHISDKWGGVMPKEEVHLKEIPGVGPYTVGAIRAFAFREKAAAVDGNVMRVLSRLFAIREDIGKPKTQNEIRLIAEKILPEQEPWMIAEALIELGAMICKKVPLCQNCPLKHSCKAHQHSLTHILPVKAKKTKITPLYRVVLIIMQNGQVLLRHVPQGEIMAGLHEFPYLETDETDLPLVAVLEEMKDKYQIQAKPIQKLPLTTHGFTRYRVRLTPYILSCSRQNAPQGYFWAAMDQLKALPFSSGHRKILSFLGEKGV